jgi:hypothetical protein
MLRIVLDTEIAPQGITSDTATGPYMRLTPAAVERAKTKLGVDSVDDLWQELGFSSRMTFWRARRGLYDIRLSHALSVASLIGWPLSRVFKGPADA